MSVQHVNRVILTGNLTKDPELSHLPSGAAVCQMRLAVNGRRKDGDQWVDKPNYFNVTVWGAHGEACERHLRKGSPVAVDGRLDWREWERDGQRHEGVSIVADNVQFLYDDRDRPEQTDPSDIPY